MKFYHARK